MADGVASRLAPLVDRILGGDVPIRVRAWDGSSIGPRGAPTFVIKHRRALRRMLWKPGEMGLVRAYVAGELEIEGDIFAALEAVQRVMRSGDEPIGLSSDDKREIVRTTVTLGAVGPEAKPPPEAVRTTADAPEPLSEGPAFFARILGPSMAYGCGSWGDAVDLDEAQRISHDAIIERLALGPGARLLDLS